MKLFAECNCCHDADTYGTCEDPHVGFVCPECLVLLSNARRILGLFGHNRCTTDRRVKIIPPPL